MDHPQKSRLRREMLELRGTLSPDVQASFTQAIEDRLFSRPEWSAVKSVAIYWPFRGEVGTQGILRRLREAGHAVYLPRLAGAGLEFVQYTDEAQLLRGKWDLMEPAPELPAVPLDRLDIILVPGVAFDLQGARLGMGKGYYDRTLRGFRGRRWALAYEFQVVAELPTDERDERVDCIFTEARSIEIFAAKGSDVRS